MRGKLISLIIFILLFGIKALGATFVVTSNADSGPGTLRDALTQVAANGSVATDYVYFNLPDLSAAGRTITLLTQLPNLSPNLVIDATTQPGASFGVSDAKVEIFDSFLPPSLTPPYVFKGSNLGSFTISGLYLDALSYNGQNNTFGIEIDSSTTVTITHCLMTEGDLDINNCGYFICQSNMIGYFPDGITGLLSSINVYDVSNVEIGGNSAQGNLLSGSLSLTFDHYPEDWTYVISNNKFGTDYTGTSSSESLFSQGRIDIESGHFNPPSTGKMHGTISNNLIENFGASAILVSGFGDVTIKGNAIGTDPTGKIDFSQFEPGYVHQSFAPTAIDLWGGVDGIVGGTNPGDKNVIAYVNNGILEQQANTVVISQNSIFCITGQFFNIHDFVTQAYTKPLPQVQINSITASSISGTATPGARVELFSNSEGACASCDPRDFFAFVTADSKGDWSYSGIVPVNVVASAIYNNQTSLFTKAKIDIAGLKVTQPKCGDNSGAIQGIKFYNAGQVEWVDQNGKVVSNSIDVNNLPPGKYMLKVGSNVCGAQSNWIELFDKSARIDASGIKVIGPVCNFSGSISGIKVATYQREDYDVVWTDQSNSAVGNTLDIINLKPGKYTLTVTGKTTGCSKTYGPVTVIQGTGLSVDQTQVDITPTDCSRPVGSVTNLIVTGQGTIKYSWTNAQQQQIATTQDLTSQIPGVYTVQISDDSKCDPVTLSFTIPNSSQLAVDAKNVKAIAATCGEANGSITGLKVNGAMKYSWTNSSGQVVGNNVDLNNIGGGDYQLTVTNDCGNTLQSQVFHIDQGNKAVFSNYAASITDVCPGSSYGSINIATDAQVKSARWVDGQGNAVGNNIDLANVSPGTYQLYLTDQNGCEAFYNRYTINQIPALQLSQAQVNDDQCTTTVGSITGVIATGGKPPYNYSWSDGNGKIISTSADANGLIAGNYTLTVTDASNCNPVTAQYTVQNQQNDIAPPSVSNLQLCSPGTAIVVVNNPVKGNSYRLYDSENGNSPTAESGDGKLSFNVKDNTIVYVSQLKGSCESARTPVKITVGISGLNIPNTITPNGDGVNDYWAIPGMENYPNAVVQIFTRYGQQVFESHGYAHPFDGTMNGQPLPVGVYYYIINLGSNCNLLTGNLTILR